MVDLDFCSPVLNDTCLSVLTYGKYTEKGIALKGYFVKLFVFIEQQRIFLGGIDDFI